MKTERRHELQTNILADWLGRQLESLRPYGKLIGLILVGAILIWIAWSVVTWQRGSATGEGWQNFFIAETTGDAEQLEKVGKAFEGTPAGLWAFQTAADADFIRASSQLYRDRETAEEDLKRARDNYQRVVDDAPRNSLVRQRALLGLAQVNETLSNITDARKYYGQLAEEDAASALGKLAAERLKQLEAAPVDQFYNWFARQKPAPPAATPGSQSPFGSGMGLPGSGLDSLSDRPESLFPNLPPTTPPSGGTETPPSSAPPGETPPPAEPAKSETPPPSPPPGESPATPPLDPSSKSGDGVPKSESP